MRIELININDEKSTLKMSSFTKSESKLLHALSGADKMTFSTLITTLPIWLTNFTPPLLSAKTFNGYSFNRF